MFEFIGWLLFLLLGLSFVFGSLYLGLLVKCFDMQSKFQLVIFVIQFFIGVLILYKAYVNAPFSIVFN